MWWVVTLTVGGVAYLIQQSLKGKVQAERERWESTRQQLQDRIRWHLQEITEHLKFTCQRFDFHTECELHFASVKIANEAYRLLRGAKVEEAEIRKALGDMKSEMEAVYRQTKAPGLSKFERDKLHTQLADLKQLKKALVESVNTKTTEVNRFREKVRQLNQATHDLKCAIRDRCGWRGTEWYSRLEARTRASSNRQPV